MEWEVPQRYDFVVCIKKTFIVATCTENKKNVANRAVICFVILKSISCQPRN